MQQATVGTSKRKREVKDLDVEEAPDQGFSLVRERWVTISDPVFKAKSEELAEKQNHNNFKTTGYKLKKKTR